MSLTDVILPFILLLGILIFVHELGHFLVAKWCGVRVDKFSLGFGPPLLRRRVGETEYVIAALPLGGFVKMLGELPGEELSATERERAFNHKPPSQRIAIALAGPLMNFALPVLLLALIFMVGLPTPTTKIGGVSPDSPAAGAGLQPGDRILEVNGRELWQFSELTEALRDSDEPGVQLVVERDGERRSFRVVRERGPDGRLGLLGIYHAPPAAVIAVTDPRSPAALAGLETGDRVHSVAGRMVNDRYALEKSLATAPEPIELEVLRDLGDAEETVVVTLRAPGGDRSLVTLGMHPIDFQIHSVLPASPARRAGLKRSDIVTHVDGVAVTSRTWLEEHIRASRGRALQLGLLRAGERVAAEVTPGLSPVAGEEGIETHYAIGVNLAAPVVGGEMRDLRVRNPLRALWMGTGQTVRVAALTIYGITQMLRGSIGLDQLAGPIGIGEIAADTFQSSWKDFFHFMALISVNLAILNLLPIPVLDGGTILLTSLEWIRGGPLPARAREFAQTVGLSFILLLMGFALWNDIARQWQRIIGFLKGLV